MKYQWYEYENIDTNFTKNRDSILYTGFKISDPCTQKSFYVFEKNNIVTRDVSCIAITQKQASGMRNLYGDTLIKVDIPFQVYNLGFHASNMPSKLVSINSNEMRTRFAESVIFLGVGEVIIETTTIYKHN